MKRTFKSGAEKRKEKAEKDRLAAQGQTKLDSFVSKKKENDATNAINDTDTSQEDQEIPSFVEIPNSEAPEGQVAQVQVALDEASEVEVAVALATVPEVQIAVHEDSEVEVAVALATVPEVQIAVHEDSEVEVAVATVPEVQIAAHEASEVEQCETVSNTDTNNEGSCEKVVDVGSPAFNRAIDLKYNHQKPPSHLPKDFIGTNFPTNIFKFKLKNGEVIEREWLVWSVSQKALFCICCKLFSNLPDHQKSMLATTGYNAQKRWKNLYERVPEHENSIHHKNAFIVWKNEVKSQRSDSTTESLLLKSLIGEKQFAMQVLHRLFAVTLFLAERGLPFRGDCEKIGNVHNGNFLGILELLSKFDAVLEKHLERVQRSQQESTRLQAHYLSPNSQNEFIQLCANEVMSIILKEREKAKYFSIIVDSTPDTSHTEQTTFLLRYVKLNSEINEYSIEERLLGFFDCNKKTGLAIATLIEDILKKNGIPLCDMRGQGYDNARNMSGNYNGCKAHLLTKNRYALHSGCSSHTLNLSGEDSACCCVEVITFFGILQKTYNVFSSSPQRWEILKKYTNSSLCTLSKTRWSARADAVKVFAANLPQIVAAMKELLESLNLSPEMIAEINGLIKYCSSFDCLVLAQMWHAILKEINIVNEITQKKGQTLEKVCNSLSKLIETLTILQEAKWIELLNHSKGIASETGFPTNFQAAEKRSRKRKRFFDEEEADEPILNENPETIFEKNVFRFTFENVINSLKARFSDLHLLNSKFAVLWSFNELSDTTIEEEAIVLINMYDKDIDNNLIDELQQLKAIYTANFEDSSPDPLTLLNALKKADMNDLFPNIMIVLRIFLTIPASVASAERTFSAMKRVKNVLRSTMAQGRLSSLGVLAVEPDIARSLNIDHLIQTFLDTKARKAFM